MRSVQLAPNCVSTEVGRAITLPRIVAGDQLATDGTAPLERLDCDVLEAEGAARLMAVVHEMHQACAQLDPGEHLDFFGYPHESHQGKMLLQRHTWRDE